MEALKYVTTVRRDDEYADVPAQAIFEIDEKAAAKIAALARKVIDAEAHKIEVFDCRTTWLKSPAESDADLGVQNQESVELDVLIVSTEEFWFAGYLKHTRVKIFTERQHIGEMLSHFDLDSPISIADRAIDLLGSVARMGLWNWLDNNGNYVADIEPPAEGFADSHAALMNLIEASRILLNKQSPNPRLPVIRAGANDLVLEAARACAHGAH